MSIKSKAFAAAAALSLVGGVGAVSALSAHASTPSCGYACVSVFSKQFGTHHSPNFVLDTLRQGDKVGQPQILFRTSNSDPAEDYTISYQGLVSDFYTANLVSSAVALHYGGLGTLDSSTTPATMYPDDTAYEIQYTPYGVDSGLCAGTATTAAAGTKVSLQPCGVSAKTVWIVDSQDTTYNGYVPLINGSDTNFSQPYVLTYPTNSYPTDMPRAQLYVTNLTGFQGANGFPGGTIDDNQLWGFEGGDGYGYTP